MTLNQISDDRPVVLSNVFRLLHMGPILGSLVKKNKICPHAPRSHFRPTLRYGRSHYKARTLLRPIRFLRAVCRAGSVFTIKPGGAKQKRTRAPHRRVRAPYFAANVQNVDSSPLTQRSECHYRSGAPIKRCAGIMPSRVRTKIK